MEVGAVAPVTESIPGVKKIADKDLERLRGGGQEVQGQDGGV